MVFDGHLHNHLNILSVVPEEIVKALKCCLRGHATKISDQEFWLNLVRMQQNTLHVCHFCVMFESVLHQASLLAELSNGCPIVMSEHRWLHLQDRLGHLGCSLQIHHQKLCLKMSLFREIVLQSIQQDLCGLLNQVLLHE